MELYDVRERVRSDAPLMCMVAKNAKEAVMVDV